MTNYENIKNMSTREMAEFLYLISADNHILYSYKKLGGQTMIDNKEKIQEWLNKEVSEKEEGYEI